MTLDEQLRIELRAAEIVAQLQNDRPCGQPFWCPAWTPDEVVGWHAAAYHADPVMNVEHQRLPVRGWTFRRWAGWLAYQIYKGA